MEIELWCLVKIYSGCFVWDKFEKREMACDINISASLPGQWIFLNSLSIILDHFTKPYDNYLIMGDFNLEPHDKRLGYFLNSNNLINLLKINTCFKDNGFCIDLILRNRWYSFKNTTSYETGLSDHHSMILTMLKTTFQQKQLKCLIYRYSQFLCLKISKVIFRKSYRDRRAHMKHLVTISPVALMRMLFGEMKSLRWT